MSSANRPIVFMDINIGETPAGRLKMELFSDTAPKTAENFRQLCTGEYRVNSRPQGYRNATFHRVVTNSMCQDNAVSAIARVSVYIEVFKW